MDYPREAIHFAAVAEATAIDHGAKILPIRQEQLKERLGARFRELDTSLLVEWRDGRREILLFVLEEDTDPSRFSIPSCGLVAMRTATCASSISPDPCSGCAPATISTAPIWSHG